MKAPDDWSKWQDNPDDPNPWYTLYVDTVTPLSPEVKAAWLTDSCRSSRQYLLPVMRPLARATIILNQLIKSVLPAWRHSALLHKTIVWGLKNFVSPEANTFILRHFNLGAEIQRFILDNLPGIEIAPLHFMRFQTLDELKDDAFLKHDLNLFNFITSLNLALKAQGREILPPERLNFTAITDGEFPIRDIPQGKMNGIDIQTAIELYTPIFQFFLSDNDFWRSVNSLQLDETIAMYVGKILNDPLPLILVNNRHPLVPHSTLKAGFRLVLHGLGTEMLHYYLVLLKRKQAAALAHSNQPQVDSSACPNISN
ncbi:MAG: hypothetical protein E6Q83_10475 [Thiothrix sp.]|nr:MAG: hypothetical protein E6Q83_10475 [Thiothrix sp.]